MNLFLFPTGCRIYFLQLHFYKTINALYYPHLVQKFNQPIGVKNSIFLKGQQDISLNFYNYNLTATVWSFLPLFFCIDETRILLLNILNYVELVRRSYVDFFWMIYNHFFHWPAPRFPFARRHGRDGKCHGCIPWFRFEVIQPLCQFAVVEICLRTDVDGIPYKK